MRTWRCIPGLVLCLAAAWAAPAAAGDKGKEPGAKKAPLLVKDDRLAPTDPFDTFPTQNYRKSYEHKFTAGRTYILDVVGSSFPAAVRVEDAAGRQLAPDGSTGTLIDSRAVFVPKDTAFYRVIVTALAPRVTGPFTVRIMEPDGDRFEKADSLTPDDPADRMLVPRYTKRYTHKMTEGRVYLIDMASPLFDPRLRVEDSAGAEVAAEVALNGARSVRLTFVPRKTDTYTIIATSALTTTQGEFSLNVLEPGTREGVTAFDKADSLEARDPLDRVATRARRKVYEEKFEAGRAYVLDLISPVFQPYLRLEDEAGAALLGEGGTDHARLVFTPRQTGTYRVIATSRAAEKTGPFTLEILASDAKDDAARRLTGRFTEADALRRTPTAKFCKRYPVKMAAGKPYVIDARSEAFTPHVYVEDPGGRFVAEAGSLPGASGAQLTFIPPAAGSYTVVVASADDGRTGAFDLKVLAAGPDAELPVKREDRLDATDPLDGYPTRRHHKTYSVRLTAGKVYDIEMTAPKLDSFLYVQDAFGQLVAADDNGGEGGNARLRFAAPRTANFTIIATTARPGATGAFSLRVRPVPAKASDPPLLSQDGTLTAKDPYYTVPTQNYCKADDFKMQAGRTYLVKVASKDFNPYVRVEDLQRRIRGEGSGDAVRPAAVLFTPTKTDTYRVVASSTGKGQTGVFALTVENLTAVLTEAGELDAASPRLTLPTPWRGKEIKEKLEAGKSYLLQVDGPGADVALGIRDKAGEVVPADAARLAFTPTRTAAYRLVVLAKQVGPFTVTVRPLAAHATHAGALAPDDPLDTQPTRRHRKTYTHALVANQPYVLLAEGKGFDSVARVLDAKGGMIARTGVTAGPGVLAVFTPGVGGPHTLVVTSRAPARTGSFRVRLQPLVTGLAQADRLAPDDPLDAPPSGKKRKLYDYKMAADRLHVIELAGKTFDPYLRLYDAAGRELAQGLTFPGKAPGERLRSQIVFLPFRTDTYRLGVTSAALGGFGAFTLTAQAYRPTWTKADALTPADPFDRQPTAKYAKTYRLEMKAGGAYVIEMLSGSFDSFLRLEDPRGNHLHSHDSGGINRPAHILFFPERSEEYKLIATSYGLRMTGPFRLTVSSPHAVAEEIGKLAADDFFDPLQNLSYQKVHTFKLQARQAYLISLESKAFLPYLRLESSRGQHLKFTADVVRPGAAHILFEAPRDDTYRVVVTSVNGGATGEYKLLLQQ
jgi:hypothetical protein